MKRILILALAICLALPPLATNAAVPFDPNYVISDAEATETSSFDAAGIQAFLAARGSGLATLRTADIDGAVKSASEIIYAASIRNQVSPRFLLALLQREQSLITDPVPTQRDLDWATGYGICDSCSMDDPSLQKYRGFANQVEYAASGFRYFMDQGIMRRAGEPTVIDGVPVTPATAATANLYNYTPHLNAQKNFWLVWQHYFVRRYPSGTLATAAPAIKGIWLIRFGERRLVASNSVLLSRFDPDKVIKVAANDLLAYPQGDPIKFQNYSLLRSPRGTVYLIVGDERRGFVSQEVFRKIGFSKAEVAAASWEDLAGYKEGTPITMADNYPTGALLQDPKTRGVYFVQGGIKRPLVSPELLSMYFSNRRVKKSTVADLESLKTGEPITLADGELVKTADSPAIYVISDGQRLPIISGEVFEKQGWKWDNVVTVSQRLLDISPLGPNFDPIPQEPLEMALNQ